MAAVKLQGVYTSLQLFLVILQQLNNIRYSEKNKTNTLKQTI